MPSPPFAAEFLRQPQMSPRFHRLGFELLGPKRSQVTVSGSFEAQVRNPRGLYLLASYVTKGTGGQGTRCTVSGRQTLQVRCSLPTEHTYQVQLFANKVEFGRFEYVGQFEVVNDL